MRASKRNRSTDRAPPRMKPSQAEDNPRTPSKERRDPTSKEAHSGGHFFQNIRNSKSKATDLGKASKGLFGKLTRSGSSHDRENGDETTTETPENYTPKIMRLTIIQQTRLTRISKRLEDSRDKTEFWLPALPWRCIDYLNLKGTEVEGLYRLSGSKKEMVMWQQRFEKEGDIDLLKEEDLYDVNVVASLLKDWLRNIPDEIFPRATQKRIQDDCQDINTERCPKALQDALSRLPPFNYYLLFAITCHLSLLTSCYDRTKMDFQNLCVCIQPSLNLERFIFRILIKDWRNCWQGCWTEKEFLLKENEWLSSGKDP
ncbi:Rho GTPase activation protein, partial [Rhizodiscina lignyota]